MSGFFSLAGKDREQDTINSNSSLFLFKNGEIYNKGFDLWQQYYQQQKHQSIQHVDFSVGSSRSMKNSNIFDENPNHMVMMMMMRQSGNDGINCQDCGNQAKKDCVHMRCRNCCKSQGFQCQTHVKSTWVPAAKRRERQEEQLVIDQQELSVRSGENPKRIKENPMPATTSGFELGRFPPEVNCPAIFRCVRLSAMVDANEQMAYQTTVNIGGHVFKGILYDQGPKINRYPNGTTGGVGGSSSQQPLDLSTATSNPMLVYPSIYPSLNAFMPGRTQFFPPPRP